MRNANETTIATLLMPFRALKSNGVVLKAVKHLIEYVGIGKYGTV